MNSGKADEEMTMREIGGYIELEHYHGNMLYEDGIKLDCGRNCLAYLIKVKKIKKLAIPYFMCDSDFNLCTQYGVELQFYQVGLDLRISEELFLDDETWLYVVNYFGQIGADEILTLKQKYDRLIVDNAQAYFEEPVAGVDTLYTCRKFFGVPDGGILFTDAKLDEGIMQSESYENMVHLLGRYERCGSDFYKESVENNKRFAGSPLRTMSKLTENLLRSIDYTFVKDRRTENYLYLNERLGSVNELRLKPIEGAFAYPLLIADGAALKKHLIQHKIFVPTLWPNVLQANSADSVAYRLANDILSIPCDQRYGIEDMQYICDLIDAR